MTSLSPPPIPSDQKAQPYVLVGHSHKDSARIVPIIEAIREKGFRVRLDRELEAGDEWTEAIADGVANCKVLVAFLSKDSLELAQKEMEHALDRKIHVVPVHLDGPGLLPPQLIKRLGSSFGVTDVSDHAHIVAQLTEALEYNDAPRESGSGGLLPFLLGRRLKKRDGIPSSVLVQILVGVALLGLIFLAINLRPKSRPQAVPRIPEIVAPQAEAAQAPAPEAQAPAAPAQPEAASQAPEPQAAEPQAPAALAAESQAPEPQAPLAQAAPAADPQVPLVVELPSEDKEEKAADSDEEAEGAIEPSAVSPAASLPPSSPEAADEGDQADPYAAPPAAQAPAQAPLVVELPSEDKEEKAPESVDLEDEAVLEPEIEAPVASLPLASAPEALLPLAAPPEEPLALAPAPEASPLEPPAPAELAAELAAEEKEPKAEDPALIEGLALEATQGLAEAPLAAAPETHAPDAAPPMAASAPPSSAPLAPAPDAPEAAAEPLEPAETAFPSVLPDIWGIFEVTAEKQTVAPKEVFEVSVKGVPAHMLEQKAMVGLYRLESGVEDFIYFVEIDKADEVIRLEAPAAPGDYEIRAFGASRPITPDAQVGAIILTVQ
ncbi:MAG: toll/interleukin-1 receptor domain-containing protein [Deltaproteobacteria bacterium]|jgi:hypothetical protein|nr:toll/interleukin-1 receptor domain-containing protein [Deltaproteobacteria bacterium]